MQSSLARLRGRATPLRLDDAGSQETARQELLQVHGERDAAEKLVGLATRMGFDRAAVYWRRAGQLELDARSEGVAAEVGSRLAPNDPVVKLLARLPSEVQRHELDENPRLRAVQDECEARFRELGADVLLPIRLKGPKLLGLVALGAGGRRLGIGEVDALTALLRTAAGVLESTSVRSDSLSGAPPGIQSGGRIGPYRLEWRLGTGGSGDVYLAADTQRGHPVVLKFLHLRDGDPRRLDTIRRETRKLVGLDHPNVLKIHAFEESADQAYLVMEFVDGHTLTEEMLRQGQLGAVRSLEVVVQVARALSHAADAGVLHGDLKPGHVMATPEGGIKLGGFGLSRWTEHALAAPDPLVPVGSYIAPEVARGDPASPQSDMYALGALLHDLLLGEPPAARRDPDSPSLTAPALTAAGIPSDIAPPLARMLAGRPADRHPTYAALVDELQRARPGPTSTAVPG